MRTFGTSTLSYRQSDDMSIRLSAPQTDEVPNMSQSQSTDHLKTFITTFCDRQTTDMATMIKSSIELFSYCSPSREAILVFYSELFSEYSTYYWIIKKRTPHINSQCNSTNDNKSQATRGKIEYVGELSRRFFQAAKLKLADEREDQGSGSDTDSVSPRISSPTKLNPASSITGPASPTGSSHNCSSPPSKTVAPPAGPRIIPMSRRTSSCNSTSDIDQTPMSPSIQEAAEDDVADLDETSRHDTDLSSVDIFSELECLISVIKDSLMKLMASHAVRDRSDLDVPSKRQGDKLKQILSDWASDLLVNLNIKHSQVSQQVATELNKTSPTSSLTRQIELCMSNPVNRLLVELLLESYCDLKGLFGLIMSSSQNCDWLLAYILLEMSKRPSCDRDFASSMEFIIGTQSNINSLTYILAYLSDNNPKSMTNFPKSNIPFLISLCQSSISLLNVLASEIPDEISPSFLNNLAKEIFNKTNSKSQSNCIESLTHCVIAAPNTYKLFLLAFDVVLSEQVDHEVKSAAQVIIDSIVMRIHQRAIQNLGPKTNLIPNPHLHLIDGLLNQINNDLSKLIHKSSKSKYVSRKASIIFFRMSLIFGHSFASKVICHYLNMSEEISWTLLRPILDRFMKNFGDDGSTLVSQTLTIDVDQRKSVYWINMNTLVSKCPNLKLDLDLISQLLSDKICAASFDIDATAQLIKLCCSSLERVDHARIRIGVKHRLCKALATCFFLLLENNDTEFAKVLSYIKISLTCMYLLKQSTIASHILCRALLERSLVYGHLFNKNFNAGLLNDAFAPNDWRYDEASVRLSRENLRVSLGHRFRRLPYHERTLSSKISQANPQLFTSLTNEDLGHHDDDKPDRYSINSYLLIEAYRSSINSIEAFANLFVEFHCPIMFDKHLWPNDEALRVINEKNLAILRRFEQVPPFWDLFEFIGENKCLKSCLVLVKALLAAHLALWASATTKSCSNKMSSTSRLIPPLAQSGLIPRAFSFSVEVFQYLSPGEVYSVLSDIWQYLKDTNLSIAHNELELTREEERARSKTYLNRLRLFMCQHMPGSIYVKIFKDFYKPTPKTIPT